jgi:hypothetical protein
MDGCGGVLTGMRVGRGIRQGFFFGVGNLTGRIRDPTFPGEKEGVSRWVGRRGISSDRWVGLFLFGLFIFNFFFLFDFVDWFKYNHHHHHHRPPPTPMWVLIQLVADDRMRIDCKMEGWIFI